jgi:isopentenyl diphosphate isomerase/L-lactate dehydrogenase-like FMN-dependent dehydrogenase
VEILRGELDAAMMLVGASDLKSIDTSLLWDYRRGRSSGEK